jgi:tetratricopeptide (TPR) repeat protein
MCTELLQKAELYVQDGNPRVLSITYNNFACVHRKTQRYRNALNYLEKALELDYNCINFPEDFDEKDEDLSVEQMLIISNPAEIHLNTCAILSQMDKHDRALHHAMKALILIQDELLERLDLLG